MNIYKVTYWQEGPGRSDYHSVYVCAVSKKVAIAFVNKQYHVYKVHRDETWARKIGSGKGMKAFELPSDW